MLFETFNAHAEPFVPHESFEEHANNWTRGRVGILVNIRGYIANGIGGVARLKRNTKTSNLRNTV